MLQHSVSMWGTVAQLWERQTDNREILARIPLALCRNLENFVYPTLPVALWLGAVGNFHGVYARWSTKSRTGVNGGGGGG